MWYLHKADRGVYAQPVYSFSKVVKAKPLSDQHQRHPWKQRNIAKYRKFVGGGVLIDDAVQPLNKYRVGRSLRNGAEPEEEMGDAEICWDSRSTPA